MTEPSITAHIHQSFDVHAYFTPQIALYRVFGNLNTQPF
jgi:hypothetical protein